MKPATPQMARAPTDNSFKISGFSCSILIWEQERLPPGSPDIPYPLRTMPRGFQAAVLTQSKLILQGTIKATPKGSTVMSSGRSTLQTLSSPMRLIKSIMCLSLHGSNSCECPKPLDGFIFFRSFFTNTDRDTSSSLNESRRGQLFHCGHNHSLDVKNGSEYGGGRCPHRVVLAVVDREAQEFRTSSAELIVLVSWMLAAMFCQEDAKMRKRRKEKTVRLHMTFPVRSLPMNCRQRIPYTDRTDPCL